MRFFHSRGCRCLLFHCESEDRHQPFRALLPIRGILPRFRPEHLSPGVPSSLRRTRKYDISAPALQGWQVLFHSGIHPERYGLREPQCGIFPIAASPAPDPPGARNRSLWHRRESRGTARSGGSLPHKFSLKILPDPVSTLLTPHTSALQNTFRFLLLPNPLFSPYFKRIFFHFLLFYHICFFH